MNFASLCILAYKRPQELKVCLESLLQTIDYPCETIINFDGVESMVDVMHTFPTKFSKLIVNRGKNRGVGRSFKNCLGLAEGEFVFKVDSDIIFREKWLSRAVQVLTDNPDVGSVGLFDYNRQDVNDNRFKPENNVIEKRKDCLIVKDFVSSIYGFRRKDLDLNKEVYDDGAHQSFGKMALIDLVDNKSWGFNSVYVTLKPDGTAFKSPTHDEPLIFR